MVTVKPVYMSAHPLLAVMSRIKSNGRSKAVKQKTKAKKAFGEQTIASTHRKRPYMAPYSYSCPHFSHLLYDLILILYFAHFSIDYSSTLISTTHLENNELVLW